MWISCWPGCYSMKESLSPSTTPDYTGADRGGAEENGKRYARHQPLAMLACINMNTEPYYCPHARPKFQVWLPAQTWQWRN